MAARFTKPGMAYEGLAVLQNGKPHWTGKIEFVEKHLLDPLKWKPVFLACDVCGVTRYQCLCEKFNHRPRRIFVNSMSDLFHENVTDEMRDRIHGVMWACEYLGRREVVQAGPIFQILTKRAYEMSTYYSVDRRESWARHAVAFGGGRNPDALYDQIAFADHLHPRIWLGVSVENQKAADERIPLLLQTPAAVRFISAEPLLGPVDLTNVMKHGKTRSMKMNCVEAKEANPAHQYLVETLGADYPYTRLDWVICGGESGPGARPMEAQWARGLRDQCVAAGVPFFFKQWGEYLPPMTDGPMIDGAQALNCSDEPVRVGKHRAGALLDGREWKQFPEVAR